jgi:hypothetical protein
VTLQGAGKAGESCFAFIFLTFVTREKEERALLSRAEPPVSEGSASVGRNSIHPAVLKKSADVVGSKRVRKHSLLKERQERMKRASECGNAAASERLNVWTLNSGGSWLTITAPHPLYFS